MTFSGHMAYDRDANPMAARNWDLVKDLDIGSAAKCYLSCNIELDKALTYLMERLEEAGVAEKTAIVLAGDHYPYGLYDRYYKQLLDYELDDFNRYKSTLIFWVGGMEPQRVDTYCCNVDILPTILNLWGFAYDSRMLAGTDIFSDGEHVAVLADKSFYTDIAWVNGSTGEIRWQVPEEQVPDNYVENMIRLIETKMSLSEDILNTAYFNFIFDKGEVSVNRKEW
jgi:phosphoglycerol transferase MdoB-like AlkP superfamily enzyme